VYDVFVSYRHSDSEIVGRLVSELEKQGLAVWFDAASVADFGSISEAARVGLAESKAVVVFYSQGYPNSSPCQWELSQAFVAAMRLGDPRNRVLVVNPESGSTHIEPVELRDALYGTLAGNEPDQIEGVAAKIAAHTETIGTTLGSGMAEPAMWLPSQPSAATRFAGRFRQIWQIHSAIHAHRQAMTQGAVGPGVCIVRGMGGVGKSLLAREYALRYQASFPGGVFWLYAQGDDSDREALRLNQMRGFAPSVLGPELGSGVDALTPKDVEAAVRNAVAKRGEPSLWIVDDLPDGLDSDEVFSWIGPPGACTVLTTRSGAYGSLMPEVALGVLDREEALQVLISRRPTSDVDELEAAARIVAELGGHALAIDVAGATLRFQSFGELLENLLDPEQDELELAAALKEELPTGRERSISTTLSQSLNRVGEEARDLLRIAAMLARDPVPRSFLEATFRASDGIGSGEARILTIRALDEAFALSLIEPVENGLWQIHPLLARTIDHKYTEPSRGSALHNGAVSALKEVFENFLDGQSRDAMRPLVAHARKLASRPANTEEAELSGQLAGYYLEVGDYSSARATQEAEVAALRRLLGSEDPRSLSAICRLAITLRMVSELREARQLLESVVATDRETLGSVHRDTLLAIGELGRTLFLMDEPETARSLAEEALSGRREVLGPDHPETLRAMSDLAIALDALGDSETARALIEEAVGSYRRVIGSEHPETLKAITLQVAIDSNAGDLQSACRLAAELLATRREVLGDHHPDTLLAMNNLAYALWQVGRTMEARTLAESALEGNEELFGKQHLSTLCTMDTVSCILRDLGELSQARVLGEEAVSISREVLGPRNDDTLVLMTNLVETLKACGDMSAARSLGEEVVTLSTDALGADHRMTRAAIEALSSLGGSATS
jgi:tetratricopeptide (TPR) repeat protein